MWPRPGAADEFLKFICLFLSTILSPLTKKSEGRRLQSIQQVCEHSPPPFNRRRRRKRPRKSKSLVFFYGHTPITFSQCLSIGRKREIYNSQSIYMGGITCVSQEEEGLGCSVGNVRALLAAESRWVHVPRHFSSPLRLQLDANVCNLTLCLLTRMRPHPNNNNKTEKTPFSVPPSTRQLSDFVWLLATDDISDVPAGWSAGARASDQMRNSRPCPFTRCNNIFPLFVTNRSLSLSLSSVFRSDWKKGEEEGWWCIRKKPSVFPVTSGCKQYQLVTIYLCAERMAAACWTTVIYQLPKLGWVLCY